jgi:hypothetical protein
MRRRKRAGKVQLQIARPLVNARKQDSMPANGVRRGRPQANALKQDKPPVNVRKAGESTKPPARIDRLPVSKHARKRAVDNGRAVLSEARLAAPAAAPRRGKPARAARVVAVRSQPVARAAAVAEAEGEEAAVAGVNTTHIKT